ncbi:competence type IV pilus major pilin ComGC [Candidatus Riflebacteria bacterium]
MKTKAFTLIELMVVIGVISILIGIVVPGYRRIRYRVRLNACRSNMKVLWNSSELYLFDHEGVEAPDGSYTECNVFQKKLVKEQYIKNYVLCPASSGVSKRFYAIYNEKDAPDSPMTVKCVSKGVGPKHGYFNGEYGGLPKK